MTTRKTIALTRWTFVDKVMSLLLNMLSRLVITFLPTSKYLLISWLQSPSAVILEPKKIKSDTVSTVSPSICHEVMGHAPTWFAGGLSWGKLLVAFCISVLMNSIFAPVFMTLHKITDIHIQDTGGSLIRFFKPIPIGNIMANRINWQVQWGFVFKKTIPLFWYPAHTITFLLPGDFQVLFAAFLGVVLGLILSIKK